MSDSLLANRPLLLFLTTQNDELVKRKYFKLNYFTFKIIIELYEQKHSVIAIYRMLPPLAQQCLLQMIFRKNRFKFSI
jgi:hypothetical protein